LLLGSEALLAKVDVLRLRCVDLEPPRVVEGHQQVSQRCSVLRFRFLDEV
jgi:hypothetical protein